MSKLALTKHAVVRMAQRGICVDDADLIAMIGTEVGDGYLVLAKDCDEVERELKKLRDRIRRVRGKRLVVAGGRIVTAYHAPKNFERQLLRQARKRDQY